MRKMTEEDRIQFLKDFKDLSIDDMCYKYGKNKLTIIGYRNIFRNKLA